MIFTQLEHMNILHANQNTSKVDYIPPAKTPRSGQRANENTRMSLIRTSQTEQIILLSGHYYTQCTCTLCVMEKFPFHLHFFQKHRNKMIKHTWFELGRHTGVEVYRGTHSIWRQGKGSREREGGRGSEREREEERGRGRERKREGERGRERKREGEGGRGSEREREGEGGEEIKAGVNRSIHCIIYMYNTHT